jgi:hypothetical protein
MRVLGMRLQLEEINNIDEADLEIGKVLPQQDESCKGFPGGNVAGGAPDPFPVSSSGEDGRNG